MGIAEFNNLYIIEDVIGGKLSGKACICGGIPALGINGYWPG
jgi:hypothetical protein